MLESYFAPAPTKLYLPILAELAALSKRNEYSAPRLSGLQWSSLSLCESKTDLDDILRYASAGVNISADMVAHNGTTFGGVATFSELSSTFLMVSKDGCTSS